MVKMVTFPQYAKKMQHFECFSGDSMYEHTMNTIFDQ